MSMSGFLGMRGTGDWVTDQRPKSWREQILYLYPNGSSPLTALMSKLGSQRVDDPEFNWWTETIELVRAAIVSLATDSIGGTAYVSGGSAGDTLYVELSTADAKLFRVGHQILLRDVADLTTDCVAKVTGVAANGLTIKLLENDDNGTSDLSDADEVIVIGNIHEEGASMPNPVALNPVKYNNYTQIFRTSLEITRTAMQTRLRTRPQEYAKLKMEALERHGIEMEFAFLFGIATEGTGTGGKPERTTRGLIPFIKEQAPNNVGDYPAENSGTTWLNGGLDWFEDKLELAFRFGASEKLVLCGNGALLGLSRLARSNSTINIEPGFTYYGSNFRRWTTEFGDVYFKTHPLFNNVDSLRNSMIIFEPRQLKYRYIQDTKFYPDNTGNNHGDRRRDAKAEEWLTECGLEMHHPQKAMYLTNIGVDG